MDGDTSKKADVSIEPRRIKDVRVYVAKGGGADYHDQSSSHWILGRIATPISTYPEYKERYTWGLNVLGTIVVEVEDSTGEVGFGVSTGGYPAAWIVENHLKRFVVNKYVGEIEKTWDQMFRATIFYGRRGLVMNAISAVDLALWDLTGKVRGLPVYDLLGGPVRDELVFYATGPRPDIAKRRGFVGGKLPLRYGPADGIEGLRENVKIFKEWREQLGDDFLLMYDCWMSLDLPYAMKLINELKPYGLYWIEEPFLPDDYWSYGTLAQSLSPVLLASGEHESTVWGFRLLLEMGRVNVVQPDITWVGGITPMLRIAALAEAYGAWIIPHGSSVYGYHFVITRTNSPMAEYIMVSPDATEIIPQFSPLLIDEPTPENGRIKLSRKPGFGVELNRKILGQGVSYSSSL
jgi:L-rhamnonate dehydratase